MDVERAREYLLSLPHVVETMQWGERLVFWVGDKAVGGKMFAILDLAAGGGPLASFASGSERASELCEMEGLRPAPYLARAGWVAVDRWGALTSRVWMVELEAAHARVLARLPAKVTATFALPAKARSALIEEKRQALRLKALAAGAPKSRHNPA